MSATDENKKRPSMGDWAVTCLKAGYFFLLIEFCVISVEVWTLNFHHPRLTAFMKQELSRCVFSSPCRVESSWRDLREISPFLQKSVILAEDPHFIFHRGIDGEAVQRALALNLKEGRIVRGASTLTQQLAKNLYLSSSKSVWRKFNEMLIALWMDRVLSKQRILELYLNVAEWGPGVYGAESASQFYFKKPASELSLREAVYLASILPNPVFYSEPAQAAEVSDRENYILNAMGDPDYQTVIRLPWAPFSKEQ